MLVKGGTVHHKPIIIINAGLLLTGSLGMNLGEILIKIVFENVVCKMMAIPSQPQCVNQPCII